MAEPLFTVPERKSADQSWSALYTFLKESDTAMVKMHVEEVDVLLVFTGLYSAALTTFLAQSYQLLQENPAQTSADLLKQLVALQLAPGQTPAAPAPFTASGADTILNIFWFLALVLNFASALLAIMLKLWYREYLTWVHHSPIQAAMELRQFRFEALMKWKVSGIVVSLSVLLGVSLALSMCGLLVLLWSMNSAVAVIITVTSSTGALAIAVVSVLPLYKDSCPFKMPTGWILVKIRLVSLPARKCISEQAYLILSPIRKLLFDVFNRCGASRRQINPPTHSETNVEDGTSCQDRYEDQTRPRHTSCDETKRATSWLLWDVLRPQKTTRTGTHFLVNAFRWIDDASQDPTLREHIHDCCEDMTPDVMQTRSFDQFVPDLSLVFDVASEVAGCRSTSDLYEHLDRMITGDPHFSNSASLTLVQHGDVLPEHVSFRLTSSMPMNRAVLRVLKHHIFGRYQLRLFRDARLAVQSLRDVQRTLGLLYHFAKNGTLSRCEYMEILTALICADSTIWRQGDMHYEVQTLAANLLCHFFSPLLDPHVRCLKGWALSEIVTAFLCAIHIFDGSDSYCNKDFRYPFIITSAVALKVLDDHDDPEIFGKLTNSALIDTVRDLVGRLDRAVAYSVENDIKNCGCTSDAPWIVSLRCLIDFRRVEWVLSLKSLAASLKSGYEKGLFPAAQPDGPYWNQDETMRIIENILSAAHVDDRSPYQAALPSTPGSLAQPATSAGASVAGPLDVIGYPATVGVVPTSDHSESVDPPESDFSIPTGDPTFVEHVPAPVHPADFPGALPSVALGDASTVGVISVSVHPTLAPSIAAGGPVLVGLGSAYDHPVSCAAAGPSAATSDSVNVGVILASDRRPTDPLVALLSTTRSDLALIGPVSASDEPAGPPVSGSLTAAGHEIVGFVPDLDLAKLEEGRAAVAVKP